LAIDGAIILNLLVAGVLTFALGGIALVFLQRAMVRNMMRTAGRPPPLSEEAAQSRRAAARPLTIVREDPAAQQSTDPTRPIMWRMATAHAAAGLAFAVVSTVLVLAMSGMEFYPLRVLVVVWAHAWPTVLALNFLAGPDRRVQLQIAGVYFGLLAALCAYAVVRGTPGMSAGGMYVPGFAQPLLLWALNAVPSLFLLLFLNRTIRTIGPTVIVFTFVLLLGTQLALTVVAMEPFLTAALRLTIALGIGGTEFFWIVAIVGLAITAWPAWRCAAFLRDRYAAKRTSDLMVTVGAIWLLQALMLSFSLFRETGIWGAASALLPLAAWRLTLAVGLMPVRKAAAERPPLRLLLLRVFGFGRRTRRLLDLVGARWRLIGSIDLIAAPDLASRTVEPASFMAFLRGRLSNLFITDRNRLQARFAALDHDPDPDARYRINPLFCGNDMWKEAVIRLMAESSLTAMDLRGFGPERQGCVYELQTLLDVVPLSRLVFVIDSTTNLPALEAILADRWQDLSVNSPNVTAENPTLRLVDATGRDALAVQRLLSLVTLPPSHGTPRHPVTTANVH
jgi:hypothetical protein